MREEGKEGEDSVMSLQSFSLSTRKTLLVPLAIAIVHSPLLAVGSPFSNCTHEQRSICRTLIGIDFRDSDGPLGILLRWDQIDENLYGHVHRTRHPRSARPITTPRGAVLTSFFSNFPSTLFMTW